MANDNIDDQQQHHSDKNKIMDFNELIKDVEMIEQIQPVNNNNNNTAVTAAVNNATVITTDQIA